jgi:integrase
MIKKQLDGQYLVDVQPGGREGPRIRKKFKLRTDAVQYEIWAKSQVVTQEWKAPREPTFKELVKHWSETAKHLEDYDARKRLLDRIADEIVRVDPKTWAKYLATKSELTQATKNRHLAYTRAVLNRAVKDRLIKEHLLAHTKPSKEAERQLRVLTKDEVKKLVASPKPMSTVIKICLATGARWNESCRLMPAQIQAGEIRFEGTKGKKSRSVPVSPAVRAELVKAAEDKGQHERIFKELYDEFEALIDELKIELPHGQLTHVLRHTFAEYFLTHGGSLRDLQEILGHDDIKTTMRYSHFQKEHIKNVIYMNPLSDDEMTTEQTNNDQI